MKFDAVRKDVLAALREAGRFINPKMSAESRQAHIKAVRNHIRVAKSNVARMNEHVAKRYAKQAA